MFHYLVTLVYATGIIVLELLKRLDHNSIVIGFTVFNCVYTWSIFKYLRETENQLFINQFARKKEIEENNQEIQIERWTRVIKRLKGQQVLRSKLTAITEYLTESRILGGRTHHVRSKKIQKNIFGF